MDNITDLRLKQSLGAIDLISTLRTVEINAVDICNRSCSFCPQSQNYISTSGFFDLSLIEKISKELQSVNYDGRITFTGFGEPLLYKKLVDAITIINNTIKNIGYIEIVTNGDYLTKEKVIQLNNAGCTNITVSMYDNDITDIIEPIFVGTNIKLTLKHSYNGFKTVNRNEIIKDIRLNINRPCYLPFYKMMIDIDGDVLICANDWGRKGIVGNINNSSIIDIWLNSNMNKYRHELIKGNRSNCTPCRSCDIDGTMYGKENTVFFDLNV